MQEEAVIRSRPSVEFKMLGKTGSQVKDEGLLYLQWSLKESTDYISFLRGKSNVVQVFDTLTENVFSQKKYSTLESPIKGLATLGKDVFDLKHVIVDEKGKFFVDKV